MQHPMPGMRPLEAPPRLQAQQVAFAAHLRDPEHAPAPEGIEDRRLAIYRELFYNSLEGILATNYPVIRTLRGDAPWHALVRDFYREYRCHTPMFPEIAREFLRYLEERAQQGRGDPDFLLELAHYEWVELALSIDDDAIDDAVLERDGDLLEGVPVLSPWAWPLAYRYPVQQIRPNFQPETPPAQPTFLLVVRGRDLEVRFKSIDALTYQLVQRIGENPAGLSGRALLEQLAAETAAADVAAFVTAGAALLEQLRAREVMLGVRREPD